MPRLEKKKNKLPKRLEGSHILHFSRPQDWRMKGFELVAFPYMIRIIRLFFLFKTGWFECEFKWGPGGSEVL